MWLSSWARCGYRFECAVTGVLALGVGPGGATVTVVVDGAAQPFPWDSPALTGFSVLVVGPRGAQYPRGPFPGSLQGSQLLQRDSPLCVIVSSWSLGAPRLKKLPLHRPDPALCFHGHPAAPLPGHLFPGPRSSVGGYVCSFHVCWMNEQAPLRKLPWCTVQVCC